LFIEKEGFQHLLKAARIAERFDIAIMSSKGMPTTAARQLVDRQAALIDEVLVLHDFDVSGFSIYGTLSSNGRRYRFKNYVEIVDIGLRLADVLAMGLESEPVKVDGSWASRAQTLKLHGATTEEIGFLRSIDPAWVNLDQAA
jgi:DNA topoisomerase VI subunit A